MSAVLSVIVLANLLACVIAATLAFTAHSTSLQRTAPVGVRQASALRVGFHRRSQRPYRIFLYRPSDRECNAPKVSVRTVRCRGAFNNLPSVLLGSLGTIALPRIASETLRECSPAPDQKNSGCRSTHRGGTTVLAELIVAWLLPLAFGANFASAVPAARLLIVAGFFLSIRRILVVFLQAVGRPGRTGVGEVAALVVLAVFAVLLIPPLGIVGASTALVLAAGASDVYLWLALRRGPAHDRLLARSR